MGGSSAAKGPWAEGSPVSERLQSWAVDTSTAVKPTADEGIVKLPLPLTRAAAQGPPTRERRGHGLSLLLPGLTIWLWRKRIPEEGHKQKTPHSLQWPELGGVLRPDLQSQSPHL